jgi:hypothetical protein
MAPLHCDHPNPRATLSAKVERSTFGAWGSGSRGLTNQRMVGLRLSYVLPSFAPLRRVLGPPCFLISYPANPVAALVLRAVHTEQRAFVTDPDPDLDPDAVEQANVAAAAIAGFTLAQFAFGEVIKNGILPRGHAEQLVRHAIETHAIAGPGNRAAAELLAVFLHSLSAIESPTRQ